ncbi:L,D-transpeptidase family protein [soil metagenome]
MERRVRWVAAAACAAAVTGACGSDREPATLPGDAIRDVLLAVTDDSVVTLAGGDTFHVSAKTVAFYAGRDYSAAWVGRKGLLDRGRALHETIGRSAEDGLPPEHYRHDVAARLLAALDTKEKAERLPDSVAAQYLADVDLLLTEGFNRYARDLVTGTLDPAESGIDWLIETDSPAEHVVLNNVLMGRDPQEIVAFLRPSIQYYERMRHALAQYRAAAESGGWGQVPDGATLKEGERGAHVAALRQRFISGTDRGEAELAAAGSADPTRFDPQLAQAVQRFQQRHSIEADGAVGAATLKELNHTVEERIAEMKLNLDRWRWLPNDLGERFVVVNIAGFEMEVVEQGRAIQTMNVVVGQLDRQTPVFADSIQHIVVNPYWNVPDGIFEKDVRPAMDQDPAYLVNHNMEMVNGRVRQLPGPTNSLGKFKFLFPNEYDVYLHDTPQGHLFSRWRRDFSSGCIRLERPEEFARLLLDKQTDSGSGQLDALLTHWNERWIKLDRPLPVYLLYFTAWVEEDGTVRFHHDVYGRDEQLAPQAEDRLEAPPEVGRTAATRRG